MTSALFIVVQAQQFPQLGKATIDEVAAAMTLEEKVHLLIGTGMAGFTGETTVVGATGQLVPGARRNNLMRYPPRESLPLFWLTALPVCGSRLSAKEMIKPITAPHSPWARLWLRAGTPGWLRM